MPFKQATWPGLDEREYRIAQGMDAAAALVIDGKLVAAAEQERFSGKKHTGDFPIDAIRFCLAEAGISIDEIDEIAHGFDYAPYRGLYLEDEVRPSSTRRSSPAKRCWPRCAAICPAFPTRMSMRWATTWRTPPARPIPRAGTNAWSIVNDAMGEMESLSVYDFHDGTWRRSTP